MEKKLKIITSAITVSMYLISILMVIAFVVFSAVTLINQQYIQSGVSMALAFACFTISYLTAKHFEVEFS